MADALEPRTFSLAQLPAGDGLNACNRDQLGRWLLDYGLARENGHPGSLELTARGAELAAGVRDFQAWIRG